MTAVYSAAEAIALILISEFQNKTSQRIAENSFLKLVTGLWRDHEISYNLIFPPV